MPSQGFRPEFVAGGTLVVVPDMEVPLELGGLTLRRVDGLQFLVENRRDTNAETTPTIETEVYTGTVLGPFPPGPVRFSVRLGMHGLADATADVRPGGVTPLVVRLR
jgi:hypothetical protein